MKRNEIIVLTVIAGIIALVYFLVRSRQKAAPAKSAEAKAPGASCYPLEYGDGPCPPIKDLQGKLNEVNIADNRPTIAVDGVWGDETADSLTTNGLENWAYGQIADPQELNDVFLALNSQRIFGFSYNPLTV